jgi:hypothetical protein
MSENEIDPGTVVLVALAELRGIPEDAWTDGPVSDRAMRLDRALALMQMLKEGIRDIELSLIDSMEEDEVIVTGVGKLVRSRASSAVWKDKESSKRLRDDLAAAVAQEIALDVATGEMDPMKRNVALATLRLAYEAIPSFATVKVAGRDRLGIDIFDYRVYTSYHTVSLITEEVG